jgi:hypothetical protein
MLRIISTKGNRSKGNNNDRPCLHLWICLYQPRGVCPPWADRLYVCFFEEASSSPMPVSTYRLSVSCSS